MSADQWECVLPNGKFATLRKARFEDIWATDMGQNLPAFIARLIKLDGVQLTPEEVLAMDLDDIAPVIMEISKRMKAMSFKGVA